jgi:ABC-2 type transport system ATP-binding protein
MSPETGAISAPAPASATSPTVTLRGPDTHAGDTAPAVALRGLVKRFEDVTAVDGLDLEIRAGECFGLLGPNGAGKTTTIEILVGLQPATAGEVRVLGQTWGRGERALRARLGVSLQETRLPERLTVLEVLRLFRSFYPRGREPADVMAEVGLADKARSWTVKLSGGQRQRLALGCALVGDPELLVLDEPTTGLDPQARLHIGDTILSYRRRGRTVLVSTHYMEEAQRLCDRVAVIDHGKVIALGAPQELIATLGGEQVVEVALAGAELADADLAALAAVRGLRRSGRTAVLSTTDARVTLPALLDLVRARGLALESLATRSATLEDVFVALTGRHLRDE